MESTAESMPQCRPLSLLRDDKKERVVEKGKGCCQGTRQQLLLKIAVRVAH